MSIKSVVEVDYWENQTYKALRNSWGPPIYGVPQYSDIHGKSVKYDKILNNTVYLPIGWEWCQPNWLVDLSGEFGDVDTEGWGYSPSFEISIDQSNLQQLKSDRNAINIFRRRRWIRNRVCCNQEILKYHLERVDWIEIMRTKINDILNKHQLNFLKLSDYYRNQRDMIDRAIKCIDQIITIILQDLGKKEEILLSLKSYFIERSEAEALYASKLEYLGTKWIHKSGGRRLSSSVTSMDALLTDTASAGVDVFNRSFRRLGVSVDFFPSNNTTNEDDFNSNSDNNNSNNSNTTLAKQDPNNLEGDSSNSNNNNNNNNNNNSYSSKSNQQLTSEFFNIICASHKATSMRLNKFADKLATYLPSGVDVVLDVLRVTADECKAEFKELKASLMQQCTVLEDSYNMYLSCRAQSNLTLKAESSFYYSAAFRSSAAIEDPIEDDMVLFYLTGGTTIGVDLDLGIGLADTALTKLFPDPTNRLSGNTSIDSYLAIQRYFIEADMIEGSLLIYDAFSKQQQRKLESLTATICNFLDTAKVVIVQGQLQAWQESLSDLVPLGLISEKSAITLNNYTSTTTTEKQPSTTTTTTTTTNDSSITAMPPTEERDSVPDETKQVVIQTITANDTSSKSIAVADNVVATYNSSNTNDAHTNSAYTTILNDAQNNSFRYNFFNDDKVSTSSSNNRNDNSVDHCDDYADDKQHCQVDPFISFQGTLSYYAITRADYPSNAMTTFTPNSIAQLTNPNNWTEAVFVVITYDRVLHIVRHKERNVSDMFDKDNLLLSVNLRNIQLNVLHIPKEEFHHCFELLLTPRVSLAMSLLNNLTNNNVKDIISIIFNTDSSESVNIWMNHIYNPFQNPYSGIVPDSVLQATNLCLSKQNKLKNNNNSSSSEKTNNNTGNDNSDSHNELDFGSIYS